MTARGAGPLGQADLASLAQASGIDLESYRQAHVSACVARALARHETHSVAGLARLCRRDPAVRATLRRSILVPVTGLFRDPEQFELLGQRVLPALLGPGRGAECLVGRLLGRLGAVQRRAHAPAARRPGRQPPDRLGPVRRPGPAGAAGRPWSPRPCAAKPARCCAGSAGTCSVSRRRRGLSISCCAGTWPSTSSRPPSGRVHAKLAAALRRGGMLMLGQCEQLLRPGPARPRPCRAAPVPEGRRVRRGLTQRTVLASIVVGVVVVAEFAVLFLAFRSLRAEERQDNQAVNVLATSNALEESVLNVSTGLRIYLISGHPAQLRTYRAALATYPAAGTAARPAHRGKPRACTPG